MARNKTNDRFVCTLSWRVDGVCNRGDMSVNFCPTGVLWRPFGGQNWVSKLPVA
jgi:hypothetical protein